jgi:hypothetical protein
MSSRRAAYLLAQQNRLANQLWNLAALVAYCEERDLELSDCAAVEYHRVLASPCQDPRVELVHRVLDGVVPRLEHRLVKRTPVVRGLAYHALERLRTLPRRFSGAPRETYEIVANGAFYLPPSEVRDPEHARTLAEAEVAPALGFSGFLFKNPLGLAKHRAKILAHLSPRQSVRERVRSVMQPLRARFRHVVGVHLRQGDYRSWLGGRFFVDASALRVALEEVLRRREMPTDETAVVVCSDGPIDLRVFGGLHVSSGPGDAGADLYALAECDLVVGSNSTFAAFAGYLGDTVHYLVEPDGVAWAAYEGRTRYFENELAMIHLLPGSYESPLGDGRRVRG